MAYNLTGIVSTPPLSPVGSFTATTHTPSLPNAPCKSFMPYDTATDRLLRELYLQNITDEFGNLINIPQKNLPPLDKAEIGTLLSLLNSTIHITDRSAQTDIEIKIIYLLQDIARRLRTNNRTPIDSCELIGSTISLILGISYMKRAFSELGLQNVEEIITTQLLKDLHRKIPDYDIRFNVSKANKEMLGKFTLEVIASIASQKAFDESSFTEWCSYVRGNMLDKFKAFSGDNTDYSIISTGNHVNTALEILFIKNLPRLHLFRRDAIRIVLTEFLEPEKKASNSNARFKYSQDPTIQPQEKNRNDFFNIMPISECGNGWQALIDLLTQTVYDANVETMDIQGWPLLISHITRGGRCPYPKFANAVFERMAALSAKNRALGAQISELMLSALRNHHHNDPFAGICLAVNSACLLSKEHLSQVPSFLKDIIPALKKIQPKASDLVQNPSEKILELIFTTIENHPSSIELISAVLQVHAFHQLSKPRVDIVPGMPLLNIRKHDGTPHIEFKFCTANGFSSILLPFMVDQAFEVIENSCHSNAHLPEDLVANLRLLGTLMTGPVNVSSHSLSPIISYQEHLKIDIPTLANKVVKYIEGKDSLLTSLSFSIAAACELIAPGLKNIDQCLMAHLPKALIDTQSNIERQALFEIWRNALPKRSEISCKSLIENAEKANKDLSTLQSSWVYDLAHSGQEDLSQLSCQLLQSYKLPPELFVSTCKNILPILIIRHSKQALPIFKELLHSSIKDDELWSLLNQLLEANLEDINKQDTLHFLPNLGNFCSEVIEMRATCAPLSQNLMENLAGLTEVLIKNQDFAEAERILTTSCRKFILSQPNVSKLWNMYIQALADKKGPLAGLTAWENALRLKIWNDRNLPIEAQQLLSEITSRLYDLQPRIPDATESKYYKQCIAIVKDPSCTAEMQSLSVKHVERLLEGDDKELALKEVYTVPSKYLSGDNLFDLKVRLLRIEIEETKLPQACTSLKELLEKSHAGKNRAILKSIVFELLDKLLADQQSSQQLSWNINFATQLLLSTHLIALFEDDMDSYLSRLQQALTLCCQGDPNNNRRVIYELLEKFIELGFKPTKVTERSASRTACILHVLSVMCPPKYTLPINVKSGLIKQSQSIFSTFAEEYPAEKCIAFFALYHAHSLKPVISEESLRQALNNIAEYVISKECTRQKILETNQFINDYLSEDCIRKTLRTGLSLRLLSNLVTSLLTHSSPQQAIRWINVLTKLSTPFYSTWYEKIPAKILEWTPALRKEKEHKKCLELLLLIKDHCPSKESVIITDVFNTIDAHLIRRDIKKCGSLLVDHAPLFRQHIPPDSLKRNTEAVFIGLLKDHLALDRIRIAIKLLSLYPFLAGQSWLTAMSQCTKVTDPAIQLECWKTFSTAVENPSFLAEEKALLAACWLSAVGILQSMNSPAIMNVVEQYTELKNLFDNHASIKQHEDFLVKLFVTALQLPQSPVHNQFLLQKLHPLRQSLDNFLKRPEACAAKFAIDLAIVKGFSQTGDYVLYRHAHTAYVALISSKASNDILDGLTTLFMGAQHFKEDVNPGIENVVIDLQKDASNLHELYNPLPIIPTFLKNPSFEILDGAMNLLLKHYDPTTAKQSNTVKVSIKTAEGLLEFFHKIIWTNHAQLIFKLNTCLNLEKAKEFTTESQRLSLYRIIISKGIRNAIEMDIPIRLHCSIAYFFRDFCYIAHDDEASSECIDLFLQCTMMLLCNHGDVNGFKGSLFRFNNLIKAKDASSGKPSPFPLNPIRIAQIHMKVIESALNQNTRNPYIAGLLIKSIEDGICQMVEHYKKHKLLVSLLHKYVFSPLPSIAHTYHEHIVSAQHHIQQVLPSGILTAHSDTLFEFDLFLNLSSNSKRIMPEPAVQLELTKKVFHTVCSHHSPQSLWHLIDTLVTVYSLPAFDNAPEELIDLYRGIIIAMMPFMYYNVGGMPIYEHLFSKILADPRLRGPKRTPEWQKASVQIMTLLVQRIDMLCSSNTSKPAEIPARFEPVDYIVNLFMKSFFNGCFDGEYSGYVSLVNSILPMIIFKMQTADSLNKYSILGLKLLMMDDKKETSRTIAENRLQANSAAAWIEMISGLSIPGAVKAATEIFNKCETEYKIFKTFPEAQTRAKKALEHGLWRKVG